MQEKTTLEVIAPTVEEALSKGLAELGLTAADVSMEVLDSGGKGFLGLGKRQIRVRLTVNGVPGLAPTEQAEVMSEPDARKKKAKPAPKKKGSRAERKPASVKKSASSAPKEDSDEPLLKLSEEVVTKLLELMKLKATASARYDAPDREGRKSVYVEVNGKDLGVLIGRRGETINAFQRIAALIVSKEMSRWVRLSVDVEGHRNRREQQLRRMARQLAEQVTKSKRRQSLEPMPANERRIVHMELQNHADVITNSVGEDPQRKVQIEPKN
ncbi:MAG: KH domain-containing protein [Anaerolineae bacterium]|jgi:spoIIIJ-associated protein|nr:KH domain-containing protein [Anaerolineae bacterium]MBT7072819.1 KH domain-containing protein [Anaerolineae bacterium]MBT7323779.1 KH domain-containing protein [Anaerolineae bacterium]